MALDVARLGFVVDATDVGRATTTLDRLGKKAGEVSKATDGLTDASGRLGKQADRVGSSTAKASGGVSRLGDGMAKLRTIAYAAAAGLGAMAGALVGGALIRTSDQYIEMTNSLRLLGLTADQAADRLNDIGDIARRTRTPLAATTQLYQRVSIASRELGASQADVMRFTENVGLALAQQGGSAESASGALMQLSQALAGGVVRAEEFNSILEGAYPIAQAAADGIDKAGGSIGRLRQLMLDGQVTSKMFFDAILSQTPKLSAAFAGTVPTVGQAMQVLRDQWTLAVGQMSGGTSALSTAILRLADGVSVAASAVSNNMNQIVGFVTAAAAAYAVYMTPAIYATTAALYAQIAAWVTLRGAMIATGVGVMIVAAGVLIGKFLDLAQAVGGFGNAMQAVGQYAAGVLDNMRARVALLAEGFGAAATYMQGVFLQAFATIARGFAALMSAMSAGLSAVGIDTGPGLGTEFAAGITQKADNTIKAGTVLMQSVAESARLLNEEAAANLNALANRLKAAEGVSAGVASSVGGAPPIPAFGGAGGGSGGGKGKGGGGAGAKSETEQAADKAREALEKLRQEHAALQATIGMTEVQERAYRAAMDLGTGATAAQRAEVQALVPEMARLEDAQRSIRDRAQAMEDGFREAFTSIVTGAENARDAVGNLLGKLADMMANRAFDALLGGFNFGGLFGGGDPLRAAMAGAGVRSFAGGGYTGNGQRSGGLDGEGGFMALVHPRETITDHTRGGAAGNVHVTVGFDRSTGSFWAEVDQRAANVTRAGIGQYDRGTSTRVEQVNRDPLRR